MPTYAYACKACSHRFEQYQSFTDDALVTCPSCHEDALRKQFGSVGIAFKGSGFYSTDSKSGSSVSTSSSSSDASSTSSSDAPAAASSASSDSTSSASTTSGSAD